MRKALEPPGRVVAEAARRPAAGQARAAPGRVVGEGDQRIAAILANPDEPAQPVIFIGEEASVGVGDPDAVAVRIILIGEGAARLGHGENQRAHPPEPVIGSVAASPAPLSNCAI